MRPQLSKLAGTRLIEGSDNQGYITVVYVQTEVLDIRYLKVDCIILSFLFVGAQG